MKVITPIFKNDIDKLITLAMIICSLFFIFIPALLVIVCLRNYISESSYEISKAFFNFELLLFLIGLIFLIPVIGWIAWFVVSPILMIFNVVVIVIDICALAKGSDIKVPVMYEFL